MATLISKYSDYVIQSIEFFIKKLETEIGYRDIKNLTNGRVEKINITKQHPLVALMAAQLNENKSQDPLHSGIIPAISVTPGSMSDKGFTLGQTYKSEIVDDTFITQLKSFLTKSDKEIQADLLITKDQINTILGEYKRSDSGVMRAIVHEWRKNEEINISVWSDSPDIDILFGTLIDSILAGIQVESGSKIKDTEYKIVKGLTNFNFGRVLYGTEYNLTFTNRYNNYTVYSDAVITDHEFDGTFMVPGAEDQNA